jgi:predicted nucleic acid-binding protein
MRARLDQGQVVIHPFIIGELALGSLRDRAQTLAMLDFLPHLRLARLNEVRLVIETRRLYALGIGLVDAHLIASVLLNPPTVLWTKDKALQRAAERLDIDAVL